MYIEWQKNSWQILFPRTTYFEKVSYNFCCRILIERIVWDPKWPRTLSTNEKRILSSEFWLKKGRTVPDVTQNHFLSVECNNYYNNDSCKCKSELKVKIALYLIAPSLAKQ